MATPGIDDIVAAVADAFAVPTPALLSPTRGRQHIADARNSAMWLASELTTASYREIGQALGRDRSTVGRACSAVEARMPKDPALARRLDRIRATFDACVEVEDSLPRRLARAIELTVADLDDGDIAAARRRLVAALRSAAADSPLLSIAPPRRVPIVGSIGSSERLPGVLQLRGVVHG